MSMNKTTYTLKYEYGVWRDAWEFAAYTLLILLALQSNKDRTEIAALAKVHYAGLGLPEYIFIIVIGLLLVLRQIDLFKHTLTKISVEDDSLVLFRFPHHRATFRHGDLSLRGSILAANGKTLLDLKHFQREEELSLKFSGPEEDPAGSKEPEPMKRRNWKSWVLILLLAAAAMALIYGLIMLPKLLSYEPILWIFDGLLGTYTLYRLWKLFRHD